MKWLRGYEQQKHIESVVKAYITKVKAVIAPYRSWFRIIVPQIDVSIIETELLSLFEALSNFKLQETVFRYLIKKGQISCYKIGERELFRKSELEEFLHERNVETLNENNLP